VPKGYVIITEDVPDPAGMAEYGKLAAKAMDGATLLAFAQNPTVVEGDWHGSQTVGWSSNPLTRPRSGTTPTPTRRRPRSGRAPRSATGSSFPASDFLCASVLSDEQSQKPLNRDHSGAFATARGWCLTRG